jgi:hypothetical protein
MELLIQSEKRQDWDRFYFDTKNIYRFFYVKNSQLAKAKTFEELKTKPYFYIPICASQCEYFLVLDSKDNKFVSIGHPEIAKRLFEFEEKIRSDSSLTPTHDVLELTEKNILVAQLENPQAKTSQWYMVSNDAKPLSMEVGKMMNLFREKKAGAPSVQNQEERAEEARIEDDQKLRIWQVTLILIFIGLGIVLYKVKKAKRS